MQKTITTLIFPVTILTISILAAFWYGLSIGTEAGKNALRNELKSAIKTGKSVTLDDFIITADHRWTPSRPVNYISTREDFASQVRAKHAD